MKADGSVELPNWTMIASFWQANKCTKHFFDETDTSYDYKHFSGDQGLLYSEVTYNNIHKVVKENDWTLSHDGYTAHWCITRRNEEKIAR